MSKAAIWAASLAMLVPLAACASADGTPVKARWPPSGDYDAADTLIHLQEQSIMSKFQPRRIQMLLGATALLVSLGTSAQATTFNFDNDLLAGVAQGPTRTIIGGEQFIPSINLATDVFAVNGDVFGITPSVVSFANTFASSLTGGQNVIVLEDLDANGGRKTSGNVLAAGTAANLIANSGKESGAGLFVYFNSALNVSRLVFDTNLASTTSNLQVLARFTGEVGQAGINDLPNFTASNFALTTAVPEPASAALMLAGLTGLVLRRRRNAAAKCSEAAV